MSEREPSTAEAALRELAQALARATERPQPSPGLDESLAAAVAKARDAIGPL